MIESYQGWAVDDLAELWKAYQNADKSGSDRRQIIKMIEIAQGIRGEGGSFDFALISTIGDSLCKFLEGKSELTAMESEIMKVHILAMRAVFRQDLQGDQPGLNRNLRQLMTLLCERVS